MLRRLIEHQNQSLQRDIQALLKLINGIATLPELSPYKKAILQILEYYMLLVQRNLGRLALGLDEILEELLSDTQQVMYQIRLITDYLSTPVIRTSKEDKLVLLVIQWMHSTHIKTQNCPPAFADGSVSLLPLRGTPLYFFPCVEQRSLLHLSLFFHEFGHQLYLYYKKEMDDLVSELRREIADLLIPTSLRNDRYSEHQASKRQLIVDVWYDWMQEFFCDAVGLIMGGPCFLKAFSSFLNPLRQVDFYRQPEYLVTEHPVTLLRIRFLVKRATALGYTELAQRVENEWQTVAAEINIQEDYHGFYDAMLESVVDDYLENMLVEADPRPCTEVEAKGKGWVPSTDTPVRLLNWAWQIYEEDPSEYSSWETEKINLFSAIKTVSI